MGERAKNMEENENEKERKEIVISSSSSEEMVKGESFLPKKMLRVLVVEADDSTRRIIAALLRKCSYKVSAVADGLEAWETLKGRPHNVNLILTEVELPSISGYALLTLIMEHDICKNIPVIMMSSKDSISLVLKCMLKGAADFLIKPIRKNELKNLWQHVWRRQINEVRNVPECKNVAHEKAEAGFEGNGAYNHSSDNLVSAIRNRHCREKCSDSQSSCGTPYLEAETACKPNMPGKLHIKLENASSTSNIGEHEECAEMVEKTAMPESDSGEVASYHGAHMLVGMRLQEDHTCVRSMVKDIKKQPDSLGENACFTGECKCQTRALTEPASGAIDLIGNFDRCPADLDGQFLADDSNKKVNVTPELDLSLRRMHPSYTKDERTEQHTLHHSKASAFSRYDSSKTLQPPFQMSASNFAPKEGANSSHQQSFYQLTAICNSPRHGSAPTKSQESLTTLFLGQSGQPEAAFPVAHLGFLPMPGVRSDSVYSGYGYLYPPVYYTQSGFPPIWSKKPHHEELSLPTSSSVHSTSEVNNSEQAFYLNKESTHHSDRAVPPDDKRLEMAGTIKHGSPALGLSSGFTSNLSNDVAGILSSTNEENSVPVAAIARPTESVNDNHLLVHDGLQGKDSHCNSQREAALIKFRLKRKERCYEKKVRYQSRKRLAEQRPRVKGQFVSSSAK